MSGAGSGTVQSIGYEELCRILRRAAEAVRAGEAELSRLDSFGGDGDHGTTMSRAMGQMEGAIEGASGSDIKGLLNDIGWAIMGVDGGATGPLLGSLFMGMPEGLGEGESIDPRTLAALFEAGLAGVEKRTRAKVGDKTVIDALVPAVQALRRAAELGRDVRACLGEAAEAAEEGARSTSELVARFGRAKNLGEKSRGTPDPGATSISLIFRGLWEGAQESA